ncbi:MAG TPA: family 43 glycosylhydrolase [Parafilimonas sp.]|nr:family 43 glycosylhydrolase [Parafilimonas sp.]
MKYPLIIFVGCFVLSIPVKAQVDTIPKDHIAPAPLFRDPVTDGAADPVLIWNREEKKWWMLYTQRRANTEAPDVAFCYGTDIGIASGENNGQTWVYRGTLNLEFEAGRNTFWAPDIVYHDGVYHMFVVYIKGVRIHWGGRAGMAHYTSKNLWDWKFEGFLKLSSETVIDASLFKGDDGEWRMWYKDETRHAAIMMAKSKDLYNWTFDSKPVLGNSVQEGPKIFKYGDYYWMLTDEWHGMRVYRSNDLMNWEKQGLILDSGSNREDDHPSGAHGDVIVVNDKAYVFYFTHPGRKTHADATLKENGIYPFDERRSSIEVGPLEIKNGTLVSDRSKPFDFWLPD